MTLDSLAESDTVVRSAEEVVQGWTARGGGGGGAEPQVDMLQNFLVSLPGWCCGAGWAGRAGATLSSPAQAAAPQLFRPPSAAQQPAVVTGHVWR